MEAASEWLRTVRREWTLASITERRGRRLAGQYVPIETRRQRRAGETDRTKGTRAEP
jgi:hypothetical protein